MSARFRRGLGIAQGLSLLLLIPGVLWSQETPNPISAPIDANLNRLLAQEDTDRDRQISVDDTGPKRFEVYAVDAQAYLVEGTYQLSNLLQELVLARREGREQAALRLDRLYEEPVGRLSRMIREHYWDQLTRRIDAGGIQQILVDPKAVPGARPRIYIPSSDPAALDYYQQLSRERVSLNFEVVRLPERITPEYVKAINDQPGVLSLALGPPFVVPGGRFNELYGWDSYFIVLGLLADGRIDLARAMVTHFLYQLKQYGKILTANRSYYLTRSQPPFPTSMALAVHEKRPDRQWLSACLQAAVDEYERVWTSEPHLAPTGLSRYYDPGLGLPPEAELEQYKPYLEPYARKYGVDLHTFARLYQEGKIEEPQLDEFVCHDRAMRESGHDGTYRSVGRAAHVNPVSLNALLYKYEVDIAKIIRDEFQDRFVTPDGRIHSSWEWMSRAERRKQRMNELMWDQARGMFFDYDFVQKQQVVYVNATTFYPLWAGLATPKQAQTLIRVALPQLETPGGVVESTRASRGPVSAERPQRQWDYPFGWAPHQMLIWRGLANYGFDAEARRLAYRWLHLIALNATRYNGAITEKYDVVDRTLKFSVEYGNVGSRFEYVPDGGFGWTNASFQVGLSLLTRPQRDALGRLLPPEWIFGPIRQ